ncbi:glycoside hydrolase family 15 [Actinomyces sp. HMSC08A09]|uniref:glycoside hydrolase family 15 n=1 Tax=Actinomyces sp. HMSC08A09 TaxID=1581133 RepID=UPI0008A2FE99|nr:glycoside hydrolase family 15 [Actinomyces sp. HMSC08A09]OFT34277.1 glycoside hydrolase family 15 [Actinomyces sp. HMSC08A09]
MRPLALPGRRRFLALAAAVPLTAAAVLWGGSRLVGLGRRAPTLLSGGLVVGGGGVLYPMAPDDTVAYVPGTRLPRAPEPWGLTTSQQSALARQALARRQAARLPQGRWADLADGALTDLLALTGPALMPGPMVPAGPADPSAEPSAGSTPPPTPTSAGGAGREGRDSREALPPGAEVFPPGAVVAAPMSIWRYVWPRDAAFAAAAFSAVNLADEALGVLGNLASWQRADGGFEARYTSSGRVPDNRPAQADGAGWFLWAAGRLLADGVPAADLRDRLGAPLARAASRLLGITDTPSRLPAASPDYWEVAETVLTLGTAAPVLLGLEAATALARAGIDLGGPAQALAERVTAVRSAMERNFAPAWGRHLRRDDVDAAIALVLPPFTRPLAGARTVRQTAAARMHRPTGGLAPGAGWRDDGISWTPETALMAWSALALGMEEEGTRLLAWLEAHRTAAGALPEKVLADGAPAGPAPLAWTCALILLATGSRTEAPPS